MASDPLWINEATGAPAYTAQELRRGDAVLLYPGVTDRFGARQGVRPGYTPATLAGTTWTVNDLTAVVYPGLTSISGPYRVQHPGESGSTTAADGTNPRIDALDLQIQDDDEDASGQRRARIVYAVGTPAASPSPPSATANSLRLAEILVPAGGSPSPTLTVVTPWTVALGGILPVRDSTELPTAGRYVGMAAYRQDLDEVVFWNGSSWTGPGPTAQTDHDTQAIGTISSTTYTATGGTDCAVVFTAPLSGKVILLYAAMLDCDATNVVFVAPEVRTGATIGSGTIVLAADDTECIRLQDESRHRYGAHTVLTGLTAGSSYNARLLHKVSAGSAGVVDDRRLTSIPLR